MRSAPRSAASPTIAWPIDRDRTVTAVTAMPFSSPSSCASDERRRRRLLEVVELRVEAVLEADLHHVERVDRGLRSFASAIAVATISSPTGPSFIGTSTRWKSAPGGSSGGGAVVAEEAPVGAAPHDRVQDRARPASHAGPA